MTTMMMMIIIIINNTSPSIGSTFLPRNNSIGNRVLESKSGKSTNINSNSNKSEKSSEKDSKSNKSESKSNKSESKSNKSEKSNGKGKGGEKSKDKKSKEISTKNPTRTPTKNPTSAPSVSPIPDTSDPSESPSELFIDVATALPTTSPTDDRGECEDSNTFRFNNDQDKNCDTWVSENPTKRCKRSDPATGKNVRYFCPNICKTTCQSKSPTESPTSKARRVCTDSITFRFNNEQNKDCARWVFAKPKRRCNKNDPVSGKKVRFFCPTICKTKCKPASLNLLDEPLINMEMEFPSASPSVLPSWDRNTIMDVAERIAYLSTLVELIFRVGLYGTLSAAGPYTVFAPTNTAFLESLVRDGSTLSAEQVSSILTYHVVEGIYTAADLIDGLILTTLQGDSLKFESTEFEFVNGEKIIVPDIPATNGIVHFIDGVLVPKG
jgi:uncharacterized surface protein with fasciclin (FAS1) repeats